MPGQFGQAPATDPCAEGAIGLTLAVLDVEFAGVF